MALRIKGYCTAKMTKAAVFGANPKKAAKRVPLFTLEVGQGRLSVDDGAGNSIGPLM